MQRVNTQGTSTNPHVLVSLWAGCLPRLKDRYGMWQLSNRSGANFQTERKCSKRMHHCIWQPQQRQWEHTAVYIGPHKTLLATLGLRAREVTCMQLQVCRHRRHHALPSWWRKPYELGVCNITRFSCIPYRSACALYDLSRSACMHAGAFCGIPYTQAEAVAVPLFPPTTGRHHNSLLHLRRGVWALPYSQSRLHSATLWL